MQIVRKKTKVSTLGSTLLKNTMASRESEKWKRAIQNEYKALPANGI